MRGSGVWTYGIVNLIHILGVSALFGSVLALDLRLLGVWRNVPLITVSGTTVPIARAGFVVAAISGVGLLATKATEYVGNPFLLIKFPAIAIALVNVMVIARLPGSCTSTGTMAVKSSSTPDCVTVALTVSAGALPRTECARFTLGIPVP